MSLQTRMHGEIEARDDIRQRLADVYWIGGSPCSGKSSIVERLAERYAFRPYTCDDAFWQHGEQATPQDQPALYKIMHMT